MVEPGRDYNYPTSSGNVPAGLQFSINGFHIGIGLILFVLALIIVWNMARKKRR